MEESNDNGKIIGALLIGVLLGGAFAILLAPDKGERTRKKFSEKGNDLADALKEKAEEFLEEIKKEVKERANEFMKKAEKGTE